MFWRITDVVKQPNLNNALRIQLSLPMIPLVIEDVSLPLILCYLGCGSQLFTSYFAFFRLAASTTAHGRTPMRSAHASHSADISATRAE